MSKNLVWGCLAFVASIYGIPDGHLLPYNSLLFRFKFLDFMDIFLVLCYPQLMFLMCGLRPDLENENINKKFCSGHFH